MNDSGNDHGLLVATAIESMQRWMKFSSREHRLAIRITNPGGLTAHQSVDVSGLQQGFDWEAGQIVMVPAEPLTLLTADDVLAITKSVRAGSSWHAYERERKLRDRITALEAEVAALRERSSVDGANDLGGPLTDTSTDPEENTK